MLKWMALILAGVITFQSLHLAPGDILGMDELVEHYRFHKKEYGDNLLTFIAKHYGSSQGAAMDHSDEEHHQSLPFQHSFTATHGPLALVAYEEFCIPMPETTTVTANNFYTAFYSSLFVNKTFQPPKTS